MTENTDACKTHRVGRRNLCSLHRCVARHFRRNRQAMNHYRSEAARTVSPATSLHRARSRAHRPWVIIVVAVLVTSASASASAQSRADRAEQRGAEVSIHVGAGSFTNPSAPAFTVTKGGNVQRAGPGPGAIFAMGWRFLPWLSAGVRLGYQYAFARNLPAPATSGNTDLIMAGFYARFYAGTALGWRAVQPWFGAGIDPAAIASVQTRFPGGAGLQANTVGLTVYSFAVPVTAGLDYNITPTWSVGLLAEGSQWFPQSSCGSTQNLPQTMGCRSGPLDTATYWFAGAGMRFLQTW